MGPSISKRAGFYLITLAGAALTAVVVAWATRYLGPPSVLPDRPESFSPPQRTDRDGSVLSPQEFPIPVHITAAELASLLRESDVETRNRKIVAGSIEEQQLRYLLGISWLGIWVEKHGKPNRTYVFDVPSSFLHGASLRIEMGFSDSYIDADGKMCRRLFVSALREDMSTPTPLNSKSCFVNGVWLETP